MINKKTQKNVVVFCIIAAVTGILGAIMTINGVSNFLVLLVVIAYSFALFNWFARRSLKFKSYFLSQYNIFTEYHRRIKYVDIPRALMFDKIIELVDERKFKLVDSDRSTYELLIRTPFSIWSWGENIYIKLEEKGNKTMVEYCSSTFFGMYSWGKNEQNIEDLLEQFEESLII